MGYAQAAGLPPITGLDATIVPLLVDAMFGPSPVMVLGPDSALAAVIAGIILPLGARTGQGRHPRGHARDPHRAQHFFPTVGTAVDGYLRTTGLEWVDWEERPDRPRKG
jgi:MFS superfamily sulfate permease-like transporter